MNRRKILLLAISFAVSALFIWLVLRQLDLSEVAEALRNARIGWICAAVGCFALGYACRIQRWRVMLSAERTDVGFGRAMVPFLASIAANNVLPFRAGDALRTFAFKEWLGIGAPVVLATLIVERLLDMLSLLLALGVTLLVFHSDAAQASEVIGIGAQALIAVSLVLAVILLRPQIFEGLTHRMVRLIGRVSPRVEDRLDHVVDQIFATLRQQAHGSRVVRLLFWSVVAWSLEGAVFYAVACALPALTEVAAAWLAFPVATLSTLIPSMPGHVGTFDFFASRAMVSMGNPAAAAAAFALLVHFVLWVTATIAGGICLLVWTVWHHVRPKSSCKEISP